jgi:hypothetical protein
VFPFVCFDSTFTSVFFAAMVLFRVYNCSCFFVGLHDVTFLVPFGYVIPSAPYLTTIIGDQDFWCSYQKSLFTNTDVVVLKLFVRLSSNLLFFVVVS